MHNSDFLSYKECGEFLGIPQSAVQDLVNQGMFRTFLMGGEYRISRNLLELYQQGKLRLPRKKYPPFGKVAK